MTIQRRGLAIVAAAAAALVSFRSVRAFAGPAEPRGRIFILMVWDGLRPDLVDARDTPNLATLARDGVHFEHHHAAFPSMTMANAGVFATGGGPGAAGILDDSMYFRRGLGAGAAEKIPSLGRLLDAPLEIEHSQYLAALNGKGGFNGRLMGVETVARQIERAGGYAAIVGKQGPTFVFDAHAFRAHRFMFISDDMAAPPSIAGALKTMPPMRAGDLYSVSDRDAWFTKMTISRALPKAKAIAAKGRPALIVLWQHNPDLVQHIAGLGTQPAVNALHECDANLGKLRAAIAALGIARKTDLMVVSDHGFATILMRVALGDLLVAAGIKRSHASRDIIVAANGGNDLVYLSRKAFPKEEDRRATLARIVDFAEAQEWCGPIFSQRITASAAAKGGDYLGWIPGTFSQRAFGLYNSKRSPDLVISMREAPDQSNLDFTGPRKPAFELAAGSQKAVVNRSFTLVRPVEGTVYADAPHFTTGMGMHGALGAREMHNFCAAAGPDFRRRFVDSDPTGNIDVPATIRWILDQPAVAGASGRVMREALRRGAHARWTPYHTTLKAYLVLQGAEIVTTLRLTRFGAREYLDGSTVAHNPIGSSP
jgi:arylsulfatase A-like enzyme